MCTAKELYEKVYNDYIKKGRTETEAAHIATAVVRKQRKYLDEL